METERIFDCHWLCVGREAELTKPGRYTRLEIDGESLILLRDNDREIRCFYNVCRHRGTQLCESPGGELGQTIRCPYHGWRIEKRSSLQLNSVTCFRVRRYGAVTPA